MQDKAVHLGSRGPWSRDIMQVCVLCPSSLLLPSLGWYLGQERGGGVLTVGILGSLSVDRRPQLVARERPRKGKVWACRWGSL